MTTKDLEQLTGLNLRRLQSELLLDRENNKLLSEIISYFNLDKKYSI